MIAPTPLNITGCRNHWRHLALECVASTNDVALQQAAAGAAEGLVVTALEQTAGRGRQGRAWHADYGDALLMSLLLRPDWLTAADAPQLSLLTALALYNTLNIKGKQLKWPNDLLINGNKLAGILMEFRADKGAKTPIIVVGIGINLRAPSSGWPNNLRTPATALHDLGHPTNAAPLMEHIIREFDRLYTAYRDAGFATIAAHWWQAHGSNQQVKIEDGTDPWQGIATGLDSDGALLVRNAQGEHRVISADVTLLSQLQNA
ncbi:MAG: biotin--[acetyl-CoA-carboxylase] ligase [Mariprofundales bacterium]